MPQPRPDDIPLHVCSGRARIWAAPELFSHLSCRHCRAPIAGDQPWVEGHAGMFCMFCLTPVGFCAGGLLAAVFDDAELAVGR